MSLQPVFNMSTFENLKKYKNFGLLMTSFCVGIFLSIDKK